MLSAFYVNKPIHHMLGSGLCSWLLPIFTDEETEAHREVSWPRWQARCWQTGRPSLSLYSQGCVGYCGDCYSFILLLDCIISSKLMQ